MLVIDAYPPQDSTFCHRDVFFTEILLTGVLNPDKVEGKFYVEK